MVNDVTHPDVPGSSEYSPVTPPGGSTLGVEERDQMTIDMLPEETLLEIFSFYVYDTEDVDGWHMLVHVCQRWRNVVFASPRRLNLRLLCSNRRPVRDMLGIWPALPIMVRYSGDPMLPAKGADNIFAALEHRDRVREIALWGVSSSLSERFATMTQEPFPALASLHLGSNNEWSPAVPNSFLGESAPSLRTLRLANIPFPALRKLLLSASDLVHLDLSRIPHSGYISPEAMVACLSGMTRLESFKLKFLSPRSRPDRTIQRPPPLTRTVLPALTFLSFQGASEYLEELVAHIDTPILLTLSVTFIGIIFHISQLHRFISRGERFKLPNRAVVEFYASNIYLKFMPASSFELGIFCNVLFGQVSSMVVICHELSPLLSRVERLDLDGKNLLLQPALSMDPMLWLELLHPFIAVQGLYIAKKLGPLIAPALQALTGERATELLPRLLYLFFERFQPCGAVYEATRPFVIARQHSDHPVTVLGWVREPDSDSEFGDWDVDE